VAPATAPRGPSVRVRPLGAERFQFRLEGSLAPGWAGNLASGLAASQFSIERGEARAERGGIWAACFEVRRLAGAPPFDAIDVAALAATDSGEGFATPLRLFGFTLEASTERGGCLVVSVSAQDTVGFLAALLRRLAYFSLFPIELRLETRAGRVSDELWLRGAGDRMPSLRAQEALRRALAVHEAEHT
jgi:hypothetical protein